MTDDEVARPLKDVVVFALTSLSQQVAQQEESEMRTATLVAIERIRACFMVYNAGRDYRSDAILALRGIIGDRT